jgi:hypothetical protein
MDKNGEHIVKTIDAVSKEGEQNEQKAVNHALRALTGMKAIPARVAGAPWYAVSIDPSRHWNVSKGEMPVSIRAEAVSGVPPADHVDTTVNREVVLCGDGIGNWRVPLVAGKADLTIAVNTFTPTGEGVLFVLDAEEPQRQGSSPSFTWS